MEGEGVSEAGTKGRQGQREGARDEKKAATDRGREE